MDSLTIKAPAKINWGLEIVGRRPDGYHLLRSLMQTVDLSDQIRLSLAEEDLCLCSRPLPEGESNIALTAWQTLKRELGIRECLHIDIEKHIPMAAGLGGGSADAAAVLRGANSLLGLGLSLEQLSELGASIGADVPFCLHGGLALVEGIGEQVTPLSLDHSYDILLVNAGFAVSTAKVYAAFDSAPADPPHCIDRLIPAVQDNDPGEIRRFSLNMLEEAAFRLYPRLSEIRQGCADVSTCAHLSGSGGTVWALCPNAQLAAMTAKAMSLRLRRAWCQQVKTLNVLPE